MQLLNKEDAVALLELLKDNLPQQVLNIISSEGVQREIQIVSECSRWFPRSVRITEIRRWVNTILDYFVRRGDIEKGSGGRYHCIPSYAIGNQISSDIWLCGDPCQDAQLLKELRPLKLTLKYKTIYETDKDNSPIPIGLERFISISEDSSSQVIQTLKHLGIVYIDLRELEEQLPRITQIVVPPESDLNIVRIQSGLWDIYNPEHYREERWKPDEEWQNSVANLVRWRPSDDWQGESNARVFYHADSSRITELGTETSSLWQLYLDTKVGNSRVVWWDGKMLWVPQVVPVVTQQWLQATANRQFQLRKHWFLLEMSAESVRLVCETLKRTLRLRQQNGRPSF